MHADEMWLARQAYADHHAIPVSSVTTGMVEDSKLGAKGWHSRATAVPDPSRALSEDGSLTGVIRALTAQASATNELVKRMASGRPGDPMALLTGSSGEDPGLFKIPGARGAAAQECYRRDFESHPGLYTTRVRANIRKS